MYALQTVYDEKKFLSQVFTCQFCLQSSLFIDINQINLYRKRSPYKWRDGVNVLKKNTVRLAEVWLDEYKEIYYDR